MSASDDRYLSLDLWRGVASLGVAYYHASFQWVETRQPWELRGPQWVAAHGWFGVHLFFVISGYCIGVRASHEFEAKRGGGVFLVDRGWRIFPVYWASLILAAVLAVAATPFNHNLLITSPGRVGALPGSLDKVFLDFTLLGPWFGYPPYLVVSWTLTCEFGFYLIVAGALALAKAFRSPGPALAVALGLAFAMALWPSKLGSNPCGCWPEFVCGGLTCLAGRLRRVRPAAALLCILGITAFGGLGAFTGGLFSTLPWAALFAIVLAALQPFDARIAEFRPLRWVGACGVFSYSLYLVHLPLIRPLRNFIAKAWPVHAPGFFIVPVALTLGSIPAALIFYRGIEAPVERLRKMRRRAALAPAAA